jgi:hypothetical protein
VVTGSLYALAAESAPLRFEEINLDKDEYKKKKKRSRSGVPSYFSLEQSFFTTVLETTVRAEGTE